jgi:outer membrane protein OmpA-like peptidoglycan-associated protein
MKARLNMSFAIAGTALILFTGCVSSRKYKASQAELAQARGDSAQLAQQVTSLNGNVSDLQNKNTALQRSLDSSSTNYTAQQRSLDYYRNYFKAQQDTMTQVSQDVRGALTQAGISNGDVQQTNNAIYVTLDENELFKKNSTMVSPGGKRVLDTLAQVIQGRSNVNVTVASGDSAVAWTATDNSSANMAMNPEPVHHRVVHHRSTTTANGGSQSGGSGGSGTGSVAANSSSTGSNTNGALVHKKVHHHYSGEGSMAIYNGPGHLHNRAWALKQGRMVAVADHFLRNGMPKINVSLQQPPMNGAPGTTIKIIVKPTMNDFSPQVNSSAAAGMR